MSGKNNRSHRQISDGGFVFEIRSLGRGPGRMKAIQRKVEAPHRIGLDLIAIEAGAEVDLDLTFQSVSEGVLVTGSAVAPTKGECVRCLDPFEDTANFDFVELFAYPNSATQETTEEGEVYHVVDDHIDLEPLIVDLAGLEFPLQPLCEPDCEGLCTECGARLSIVGLDHSHEILDPRWAGLAAKLSPSEGDGNGEGADAPSADQR